MVRRRSPEAYGFVLSFSEFFDFVKILSPLKSVNARVCDYLLRFNVLPGNELRDAHHATHQ
jgi:hypothetical protein